LDARAESFQRPLTRQFLVLLVIVIAGKKQDDLSLLLDFVCAKIGNVHSKIVEAYSKIEVDAFTLPLASPSCSIYIHEAGIPPTF
jgi:hypothetical protein